MHTRLWYYYPVVNKKEPATGGSFIQFRLIITVVATPGQSYAIRH
jgi:hypothetical protein